MKRTFITSGIIIGYLTLISFGIIASVPNNPQLKAKEALTSEIAQQLPCPAFITENTNANDVKALVRVDEAGKIKILEVNAATRQLKEYVIGQLQKMKFKNAGATDDFVLIIRFRVV